MDCQSFFSDRHAVDAHEHAMSADPGRRQDTSFARATIATLAAWRAPRYQWPPHALQRPNVLRLALRRDMIAAGADKESPEPGSGSNPLYDASGDHAAR